MTRRPIEGRRWAFRSRSPLRSGKGRLVRSCSQVVKKERRQRTPAVVALVSEGLRSETDPAGQAEHKREPRRSFEISDGVSGLDGSAVFGSSPQPSGLPQPAGRFHRGATRGELMSVTSGMVEDANP